MMKKLTYEIIDLFPFSLASHNFRTFDAQSSLQAFNSNKTIYDKLFEFCNFYSTEHAIIRLVD